jgi:hypothetical protein
MNFGPRNPAPRSSGQDPLQQEGEDPKFPADPYYNSPEDKPVCGNSVHSAMNKKIEYDSTLPNRDIPTVKERARYENIMGVE